MGCRNTVNRFVAISTVIICLLPCGSISSWGAGDDAPLYDSRIANLVTATKFPDMCAVVLIDRKIHTWSFRETTIERAYALKILSREGIEQFGDFISDMYYKELLDYGIEATVVSPRGERNGVGQDHIKKVEFGRNGYQYRVALPGLEIGAIIEIKEKVKTEYPITSGHWNFSSHVTALRSELVFRVPKGALVVFNFTPKDSKLSPTKEIDHKFEKHTITMEVIPPYRDEPYMPRHNIGNPTLYYHIRQVTMEDYLQFYKLEYDDRFVEWLNEHEIPWELPLATRNWKEIAKSFAEYFDPLTWKDDDEADKYRSALSTMIEEMPYYNASDSALALDGILANFHQRFQAIGHQFVFLNPEEILDHREGNAFELAYVLKRILEERNIPSSIVLASDASRGLLDKRNPDPYILSRPLLLISLNNEEYWIDPFSPECGVNQLPWECQAVRALWLKGKEEYSFITTPHDQASANCIARQEEIEVDANGRLSGHSYITLTGQYLLSVRRENAAGEAGGNREGRFTFINQLFPDVASVDNIIIERDTNDSLIVSCRYSIENFGVRSGDFMYLDFSGWCTNPILTAFESDYRKYEIMFPFPATRRMILRINIPPAYAIVPQVQNVRHEDLWFSFSRSCKQNEDTVVFKRAFEITSWKVDKQHYEEAKQAIMKIRKIDEEPIVLEHGS